MSSTGNFRFCAGSQQPAVQAVFRMRGFKNRLESVRSRHSEFPSSFCLAIVEGLDVSDSPMGNIPPRYNAAPSQELLVIRQNQKTGERSLDLFRWGLIPHWCQRREGRPQAHKRQG